MPTRMSQMPEVSVVSKVLEFQLSGTDDYIQVRIDSAINGYDPGYLLQWGQSYLPVYENEEYFTSLAVALIRVAALSSCVEHSGWFVDGLEEFVGDAEHFLASATESEHIQLPVQPKKGE